MILCESESSMDAVNNTHNDDDEDDSHHISNSDKNNSSINDNSSILAHDSRFSRLSFQSGDLKKSYRHRVSFDNILSESFLSYTLRTANEGYHPCTESRLFMIILDDCEDMSGAVAVIQYAMNLVDNGDEVVVIGMHHNHTPNPKEAATQLLNYTLDAQQHEDKISVTIEVVLGKPENTLRSMVHMYEPTILIVGCKKKLRKSALFTPNNNGVIHQSLKQAPVPVIFVQHPIHEEYHSAQQHQQLQQPQELKQQSQQRRGHTRTLTALSSPLPETTSNAEFNGSPSLSYRLISSRNDRPGSVVSSTNLASQLRRKFGLLKK
ncbi:hypothetical protein BDC45DRAFT_525115 [Circinella umbellata]|nr:hypothetical protein BDC45DRAFT_525115 [Circinella umbellata]